MDQEILLLDTSFISSRDRARFQGLEWPRGWSAAVIARVGAAVPAISPVVHAEMVMGAIAAGWGPRRVGEMRTRLAGYLLVPLDQEIVEEWARIAAIARSTGAQLAHNDLWIVATASVYRFPLITCDRDFIAVAGHVACEVVTLPTE